MRRVIVQNLSCAHVRPLRAVYCASFFCQLRGLTFCRRVEPDAGLLLVQARDSRLEAAIHMLGVFIPLAVVWINDAQQVVDAALARPWRPLYIPKKPARYILEMNPVRLADFHVGDQVRFEPIGQG